MKINGKVYCFFEQSGTFKNEFQKLGIPAEDYDIQNEFGETDHVIDLFAEIDKAYNNLTEQNRTEQNRTEQNRTEQNSVADYTAECQGENVFDCITPDDLIIAFFPCVYFETIQMLDFCLQRNGTQNKPLSERINRAIDRLHKRTRLHELLYKLTAIADIKKLRLIIENPATTPNYLISGQNYPAPTIIDKNRRERGDYFRKPTAYWFWNCKPTHGYSYQMNKESKVITECERSNGDGLCGGERSLMSPDYARNWICDFVLGKVQDMSEVETVIERVYVQQSLF